jgi:acetylornithine/N-succinyldiaminopimelate aminotransferase
MESQVKSQTNALMNTYARFPVTLIKGKGSYVWDEQGVQYLDYTSGLATCNLGHAPEQVKQRIEKQLDQLWHCSNLYHIPQQEALAQKLVEHSVADRVFFCNSGAEANEAAIKLARKYASQIRGKGSKMITFTQSFHGRTLATLTATGQEKIQQGFTPLVPGFDYLPYNDHEALQTIDPTETFAIMLELVQGEGGVVPAHREWLQALEQLCRQHDILLMIDEIQTGMGRTGTLFAYEQYHIQPDVITIAKGLGSGVPIGAVLAQEKVAQVFDPGSHGSTFGGNPLVCTAGLATLETLLEDGFLTQVQQRAEYLQRRLLDITERFEQIVAVRGKGLLLGVVLTGQAIKIVEALRSKNVLVPLAGPQVVRILPPLTTTEDEIEQFLQAFEAALLQTTSSISLIKRSS